MRSRLEAVHLPHTSKRGTAAHEDYRQRVEPRYRRAGGHAFALGDPGSAQAHRHQVRLRRGPVRRLHGDGRRQAAALLRDAAEIRRRSRHHHYRRHGRRRVRSDPERLARDRRAAVRLLPVRPGDDRRRAAPGKTRTQRYRYRQRPGRQHLPLCDLCAHPPGRARRRRHA